MGSKLRTSFFIIDQVADRAARLLLSSEAAAAISARNFVANHPSMDSLLNAYADDLSPDQRTDRSPGVPKRVSSSTAPGLIFIAQPKSNSPVAAPSKDLMPPLNAAKSRSDLARRPSNTRNVKTSLVIPPLPPPPEGAPDPDIEARIRHLLAHKGTASLNSRLRESREFKNPDILEKLIVFCELNEIGTNYPPEMFNPAAFTEDDYYNKIADRQANLAMGAPGAVPTFVFATPSTQLHPPQTQAGLSIPSSTSATAADGAKKRSSKWDIQEGPPSKAVKVDEPAETEKESSSAAAADPSTLAASSMPTKSTSKKAAELKPPPEPEEPSKYRRFLMERQQSKN